MDPYIRCLVLFAVPVSIGSPIDHNATPETRALYNTLARYGRADKIMFGQHRATQEGCSGGHAPYRLGATHNGHHSWQYTTSQARSHDLDDLCDVKEVTGDYPALIGFDLRGLNQNALLTISWLIQRAHKRGNIVSISWHQQNPISGTSAYVTDLDKPETSAYVTDLDQHDVDISNIVSRLLENGDHNDVYKKKLDVIAEWAKTLVDSDGQLIPVIFRPYHEMDGQWFWWGTSPVTNNSVAEYKKLFQYTVTYLRDNKGVHNFLYAFSPSKPHAIPTISDFIRVTILLTSWRWTFIIPNPFIRQYRRFWREFKF